MDRTSINAIGNLPAFPTSQDIYGGMTLRDYFAGQALIGVLLYSTSAQARAATEAYAIADAMLAERAKTSRTDETKG